MDIFTFIFLYFLVCGTVEEDAYEWVVVVVMPAPQNMKDLWAMNDAEW